MSALPPGMYYAYTVFEDYFVDKLTGLPLSAGVVTFYKDKDRTVKKNVFQLTGSYPNYSFSVLPNPSTLSAVGTFQDGSGNNIVPYFYPYDADGNIELYYITVTSAAPGLVPQFTRQAQPPDVTGAAFISDGTEQNFFANGQFLVHNDIVSVTNPPIKTVLGIDIQPIAEGGWFFKRSNGGTSVFANEFVTLDSPTSGANDFPRFAFNFICESFNASDEVRDLAYQWPGVYTFSGGNPPGTTPYTLMCENFSLDDNVYTFQVILTQNFGTGSPTAPIETVLGHLITTSNFSYFVLNNVLFPDTTGTLGVNNDDYVSISLRGPASSFRAQFRSFALVLGNKTFVFYPPETSYQVVANSVFGALPVPNPDGSDLYLKVQYTPTGMQFDRSEVGQIVTNVTIANFSGSISTQSNQLLADGSAYLTTGYSPLGIPYSRLQAVLWNSSFMLPNCGTGINFFTTYIPSNDTAVLRITTNKSGSQTATSDGTPMTGFTFATLYTGNNYNVSAFNALQQGLVLIYGLIEGAVTAPGAGTSGFTVVDIDNGTLLHHLFSVLVITLPAAGTYFTFSNTTTNYYVWFTVDGSGADPAPGGTGILVPLLSTYDVSDCASLIREAVSGFQGSSITVTSGATVPAGSYFNVYANSVHYAVWYKVSGVGGAPVVTATLIEVDINTGDTAAQVATKTLTALNMYQFAVPNLSGVYLFGMDYNTNGVPGDLYSGDRYTFNDVAQANGLLTYQFYNYLQHHHTYNFADVGLGITAGHDISWNQFPGNPEYTTSNIFNPTSDNGGSQNNPFNFAVAYAIKY